METDIAMMTAAYVLLRVGVLAAFAYLFYLVLRPRRQALRIKTQDQYVNQSRQFRRF